MFAFDYEESHMTGSDSRKSFWENTAEKGNKENREQGVNRFTVTQGRMHRCASYLWDYP